MPFRLGMRLHSLVRASCRYLPQRWQQSGAQRYSADLAITVDNVFNSSQSVQPHRAAGMELLSGYADLCPKAKLATVSKAGRSVDIDSGSIHLTGKTLAAPGSRL